MISADLDGLACLDAIATREATPRRLKVLVLCETGSAGSAAGLRIGCEGLSAQDHLEGGLGRAVASTGQPHLCRPGDLAPAAAPTPGDGHDRWKRRCALSPREHPVFQLIAQGHPTAAPENA